MKKTIVTILFMVCMLSAFGCKKQSLVGTYAMYDKDFQAGFVLEFQKDEFIIRTITNNGLVWERYAYRKDDDTYYAKSIQSFNGISWDDTQGDEEVLPLEYIGDFITLDGDTYTNWESLYGDIAESFDQGMESFFEGDWTDYFSTDGADANIMTFSGKNYSTSSGFRGTFAFKNNTLYFGNLGTTTYILDKDHFVSIPDTDGDIICTIYERLGEIN